MEFQRNPYGLVPWNNTGKVKTSQNRGNGKNILLPAKDQTSESLICPR